MAGHLCEVSRIRKLYKIHLILYQYIQKFLEGAGAAAGDAETDLGGH